MGDVMQVNDLTRVLLAQPATPTAVLAAKQAELAQKQAELAQLRTQAAAVMAPAGGGGCCQESLVSTCAKAHIRAHAYAGAMVSANEGVRDNCWVSLLTATPAVGIGTGASTGTLSVSLPARTQIGFMVVSDATAADFLCTDLQFNAWSLNKGGAGVTCAIFAAILERKKSLLPLVGKFWKGTITISGAFLNTNGSTKIFTGLGIACYNGECISWTEDLLDEQGIEIWGGALEVASRHLMSMNIAIA